jgi:hypothetical protein
MHTTLYQQRPAWIRNRLAFAIILSLISNYMMAASPTPPQDSLQRNFTVAKVYLEKYSDPGTVKVTFYESARFYKIEKTNPKFNEMVKRLKEAIKKRKVVLVTLNKREGNIIERVE